MAIGRSNLRKDVYGPLRRDPYGTSHAVASGSSCTDPNFKLCMTKGMELIRSDRSVQHSQMRLKVPPCYAAANRRACGYVADRLRCDSMNAGSPLMVTAVIKLPSEYWETIEQPKSRTYARVVAFSSNASTTLPQSIAIGDPIAGVIVNTSSKYKTAQLLGREVAGRPATKL